MALDGMDRELLAGARAAGDRLAEAERHLGMARADYHHAVRRLHLAGAPLREVAQALGISHQRVQQIVQASGGTWWSRVWHGRRVRPDMICSFCSLPAGQVEKLIAGPRVYICDGCVAAAGAVVCGKKLEPAGTAQMARAASSSRVRCSFCARGPRHDRVVVSGRDKHVCDKCLELCRRILDDRSQAEHQPAGERA
jgi:hypothetical protein